MKFKEFNSEVFYTDQPITKVSAEDIAFLKEKAKTGPKKRARICAHLDANNALHEMLIVLSKDTYIRPHKHKAKTESFHIIEGALKVVVFNDSGEIKEIVAMGDYNSGKQFYYRLASEDFHTVIPETEYVIFHETTNGPFDPSDTEYAGWAPEDQAQDQHKQYIAALTT